MADINYTVNQDLPENIDGFEQYSQEDKKLVTSFQVNNIFDPQKNYSELHILSLSDELLESDYLYNRYTELGNAQSAGQGGASVLTIDPVADTKYYNYEGAGIKLLYHFLDDLYTDDITTREFFIQDISPDRTEVVLNSLSITQEQVVSYTANVKNKLDTQSYFAGFRLNFKENDLIIATNIDTIDSGTEKLIAVKLYEPLPDTYNLKSTLTVVEIVSDSIVYEIDSEYIIESEQFPTLKPANFNIELADESVVPTQYLNYNELFSYPVSNANNQVYSLINEKGITINADYTDYSSFIHFSSAQERLINFKYKLELIDSYYTEIADKSQGTTGLVAIAGTKKVNEDLITGIVNNFDHYERFLYYESGSSSWPKQNNTKPYVNQVGTAETVNWYNTQVEAATYYDQLNNNSLQYSIPTYLRDDSNNENYLTFVYMIGQHFDNLWLYSKAVTDKYNTDNRLDRGISKDLVGEALKNFGVKLYTSNKSIEDLFTTFTGQAYQSGSEVLNYYITGSLTGSNAAIQPTSYDNYQKEIQKRIYHNLPFLLKTKGTERGLRALINCFGISSDILKIKQYGGINAATLPFLGDQQYITGSIDKIRLDNIGTVIQGNTLSNSVSILKNNSSYTTDLHTIEVGFSPSDNIDEFIKAVNLGICTKYTMVVLSATTDTYTYTDYLTNKLTQQTCDITRTFYASTDSVVYNQSSTDYFLSSTPAATQISDIDQYLGDPNNLTLDNYKELHSSVESLLTDLDTYNLQDYVRLIKFFDNTIFKMIKDFIPARSVATTGIVIKPNLLNISKAKSVAVTVTQPEYTASIDTAFVTGSDGGAFSTTLPRTYQYEYEDYSCTQYTVTITSSDPTPYSYIDCATNVTVIYPHDFSRTFYAKRGSIEDFDSSFGYITEQDIPQIRSYILQGSNQLLDTSYKDTVQTPQGLATKQLNWQTDQPLYTGELSGSVLQASNGELNTDNPYKEAKSTFNSTNLIAISKFPGSICGIFRVDPSIIYNTSPYNISEKFNISGNDAVKYFIKSGSETAVDITSQANSGYNFTKNYTTYTVTASKEDIPASLIGCTGSAIFNTQICNMTTTAIVPLSIEGGRKIDITPFFSIGLNTSSSYSASYLNTPGTASILDPYNYYPASSSIYATASILLQDNKIATCNRTAQITVYPTMSVVEIGIQDWAQENLDVATYSDGTVIPQVTDPAQWAGMTTGAWCYYIDPDGADTATYLKKLYNWYAVAGIHDTDLNTPNKKLFPSEWQTPSSSSFSILTTFLGGVSVAGGKLKQTGTGGGRGNTQWRDPNTGASNSSKFTGLPGGYRGGDGFFTNKSLGNLAYWWGSTEINSTLSISLSVSKDSAIATVGGPTIKPLGLSVRLIRPVTRVIIGANKTSAKTGNDSQMLTLYNLDTTRYRNGDLIPQASSSAQWTAYGAAQVGAWCYYDFDPQNDKTYGKLYNWYAVTDSRNIAPINYSVPTDAEWTTLTNFINTGITPIGNIGGKMKSTGTIQAGTGLWNSPNTDATNSSGFRGIPGGSITSNGDFFDIGDIGHWWSSTSDTGNASMAKGRTLYNDGNIVFVSTMNKGSGLSVRLIKSASVWQTG